MNRPTMNHPSFDGFHDMFPTTPMSMETLFIQDPREMLELPRRAPSSKSSPACCMIIGVAVLLLLLYFYRNYISPGRYVVYSKADGYAAAMRASAHGTQTGDHFLQVDPELVQRATARVDGKALHNLTPCTTEDCKNYKNLPESTIQKNDSSVRNFVAQHPQAMLMVFAPWCSHCHTSMPAFFEAASIANIPFGLVNAELISPSVISGETRVCDVNYFPTIVMLEHKEDRVEQTHLKEAPTPESILKLSEKTGLGEYFQ
jgi:thiol-disulfide isomerase/thioredoxin